MASGLIVVLVGLAVVASMSFHLPRQWTPVFVGVGLFVAGAICWAARREDGSPRTDRR
jgi:hypothetical protein